MAAQKGSFDKMLSNIRSDEKSPAPQEPPPSPKAVAPKKTTPNSEEAIQPVKVKRLRAPYAKNSNSIPFNQNVPVEVANTFYDIAREQNWTVGKTLTQAAEALSKKLNEGK
jgi:hypothetical protein